MHRSETCQPLRVLHLWLKGFLEQEIGFPFDLVLLGVRCNFPDCLQPTFSLGRKVVVVRCEGINISGNFYRNKCELGLRDGLQVGH